MLPSFVQLKRTFISWLYSIIQPGCLVIWPNSNPIYSSRFSKWKGVKGEMRVSSLSTQLTAKMAAYQGRQNQPHSLPCKVASLHPETRWMSSWLFMKFSFSPVKLFSIHILRSLWLWKNWFKSERNPEKVHGRTGGTVIWLLWDGQPPAMWRRYSLGIAGACLPQTRLNPRPN